MRDQTQIPGTERNVIPAIETAAKAYREARDTRMQHTKTEVAKRDVLVQVMRENGVKLYRFDGPDGEEIEVELDEKTKVRVKTKTPDEDA